MFRRWDGQKARKRRKALRLTQAEIAEALGVQRTTVVTWESGQDPQLRYAAALADLLGVPLDSLFIHEPEADTASTADDEHAHESPAKADPPVASVSGAANAGRHEGALAKE